MNNKKLLEEGVIYQSQLTPSSISIILFFSSYSTSSNNKLLLYILNTYIVPISLKVTGTFQSRPYVCQGICHIRPMQAYSQTHAYIIIIAYDNYFASLQFWPAYNRTCIPHGMQPKQLCATGQGDFLDHKCFKDCEGW